MSRQAATNVILLTQHSAYNSPQTSMLKTFQQINTHCIGRHMHQRVAFHQCFGSGPVQKFGNHRQRGKQQNPIQKGNCLLLRTNVSTWNKVLHTVVLQPTMEVQAAKSDILQENWSLRTPQINKTDEQSLHRISPA